MPIFTFKYGRSVKLCLLITLWLTLDRENFLQAQDTTNTINLGLGPPHAVAAAATTGSSLTNAVPTTPLAPATNAPATDQPFLSSPVPPPETTQAVPPPAPHVEASPVPPPDVNPLWPILAALMAFGSLGGFLLYQSGLTRAKNCGHAATLLLVGVVFALIGYWMGGFAVQAGGVGDTHAALSAPLPTTVRTALNHELGFMAGAHHWGLMGNSGFFLMADSSAANGMALLFLSQAALLVIAVAAALGAALERGKITAMAIGALVAGAVIYPLVANWAWGGGWLAELGHEFGVGHGFVDLAGAGVVHETAGTLALVFALVLGPRYGKFGRDKKSQVIPGHHMPFVILGAMLLLVSLITANALTSEASTTMSTSIAGLASVNTLLAALGGLVISFFLAAVRKRRPEPARLCRGLLGGAVAVSSGSGLVDPWAAFVIGVVAGLIVQGATVFLERRGIDDPVGAAATHGAGGAWGLLALGLFANGMAGQGINGLDFPVSGLFYGGATHQLAAQAIGAVSGFVVVFILGYLCLTLIQKIMGTRVELADEAGGLDWPQTGAFGYQGDAELDAPKR